MYVKNTTFQDNYIRNVDNKLKSTYSNATV